MPRVSVLLPVHNISSYVNEAVTSILNQTFTDFELIIIDDGSTDDTLQQLSVLQDPRIRIISNDTNIGVAASLNRGIGLASGDFIARMDGDDICLPERFARQLDFLSHHPHVGVCGTYMQIWDTGEVKPYPNDPNEVKVKLLFHCYLAHPTVMLRRHILSDHNLYYDDNFPHAEDYDFWVRLSDVTNLANIPEIHLLYRRHKNQVSTRYKQIQDNTADRVRLRQLHLMGIHPTEQEWVIHKFMCDMGHAHWHGSGRARRWLQKIIIHNDHCNRYDRTALMQVLSRFLK